MDSIWWKTDGVGEFVHYESYAALQDLLKNTLAELKVFLEDHA
jgi:hypothetical protein